MGVGYLARSFDLVNVRDLDLIRQAALSCSELVLGAYSDELVLRRTGRAPVVPLGERIALARHIRGVREVVVHDGWEAPTAAGWTLFSTDDDAPAHVVQLNSRRESQSWALREGLRPATSDAVA